MKHFYVHMCSDWGIRNKNWIIHCVPIKNVPDIFDCNLKTNCAILIIFKNNVPDTTKHQMAFQFFYLIQQLFLHYLVKAEQAEYVLIWTKKRQKQIWHYQV